MIGYQDESYIDPMIDYLRRLSLYDEDSVQFKNVPLFQQTSSVYAAEETYYKYGFLWLNKAFATVCANAIDNTTGQRGIITAYHLAKSQKALKSADGEIGKMAKGGYLPNAEEATVDAAFIPFANQSKWRSVNGFKHPNGSIKLTAYDGPTWVDIMLQGTPVVKYGVTTGETSGTIISGENSCGVIIDNETIWMTDIVVTTNYAEVGDSGGPIFINGGPKGHFWLVGMTFGGRNGQTGASKITNVVNQLNVTIINSKNEYLYS